MTRIQTFPPFRVIGILVVLLLPMSSLYGQSATLEGAVVKIPKVSVGPSTFAVDLSLVPASDPILFNLTAATDVTGVDLAGASTFEGVTLTIPAIQVGADNLRVTMVLVSDNPIQFQLSGFSVNVVEPTVDAFALFQENIASQIVNAQCVVCHAAGGIADNTGLVYERASATSVAANFTVLSNFVASRSDAVSYILGQATGGVPGDAHTGGAQLSVGSALYNNFETFLNALATAK